eukprot:scaffold2404_cov398-Prasinococcus_capsulatus_cf.AAC.42
MTTNRYRKRGATALGAYTSSQGHKHATCSVHNQYGKMFFSFSHEPHLAVLACEVSLKLIAEALCTAIHYTVKEIWPAIRQEHLHLPAESDAI